MAYKYTIGRNTTLVLVYAGSTVQIDTVTGFKATPEYNRQRVNPLNGIPAELSVPNGWRGSFNATRSSDALDALIAAIEAGFWSAGTINTGTIYQYITEADGSQTTYEFINVTLELSDGGDYRAENPVTQTLSFFAGQRTKIS